MTLSKKQIAARDKKQNWEKSLYIRERELLSNAWRWPEVWGPVAREAGFTSAAVEAPWKHPDAGRLVALPRNARTVAAFSQWFGCSRGGDVLDDFKTAREMLKNAATLRQVIGYLAR